MPPANLSTSQAKAAKDAFFDSFENIILENNMFPRLIKLPSPPESRELVKRVILEEAYVIEEPMPLDLSLIEPPEIV